MKLTAKLVAPLTDWKGRDSDPQILVYDKARVVERLFPFTDELQRLFAVNGHPHCLFAEVEVTNEDLNVCAVFPPHLRLF